MQPDAAAMRDHLRHLFARLREGCESGRVELAWTDPRDKSLRYAVTFDLSDLDALVDRAIRENSVRGQNIYIGAALRKPGTPAWGRCNDSDFFSLPCFYTDIDDNVTASAAAKYRERGCPPSAVVITGRHPHVRAQLYWRLTAPVQDATHCRSHNLAIAQALGGDTSVVNPSRVLRLAGSMAWPVKEGRVLEKTEFHEFNDGWPKTYSAEEIENAFSSEREAPLFAATNAPTASPMIAGNGSSSTLQIGTSNVSVESCLASIRSGDHWHDNVLRLVGHWMARGWSDEQILTEAEQLTLPGYMPEQTRREVAVMIAGGRRKWGRPRPAAELGQSPSMPAAPLKPNFLEALNIAMLPRRAVAARPFPSARARDARGGASRRGQINPRRRPCGLACDRAGNHRRGGTRAGEGLALQHRGRYR
jgi:hypothetical protein